jgi:hypothetical protein
MANIGLVLVLERSTMKKVIRRTNGYANTDEFPFTQSWSDGRYEIAQQYAGSHSKNYPKHQEPIEEGEALKRRHFVDLALLGDF